MSDLLDALAEQCCKLWIATKDKLPEHGQQIYFAFNGVVHEGSFQKDLAIQFWSTDRYFKAGITSVTHWMPRERPAPPHREQDAFEMWRETDLLPVGIYSQRECFNAGASHATKAERARFSEGVEKIIHKHWAIHDAYPLEAKWADLRALAAGKGET